MEQKTGPVVGSFNQGKKLFKGKKLFPVLYSIVLLAIVAVVLIIIKIQHDHQVANADHGVCSKGIGLQLVNQAAGDLSLSDFGKLSPIAVHVMALNKYQKDVNCVFVVTDYYANNYALSGYSSDYILAQSSLATFNKLYDGSNVNPNLTNHQSVTAFRNNIAKLDKGPTVHNLFAE